jgi:hypothetical protein
MQFIDKIKYIIIHYLYESPIEEINVSSLANELTKLNSLIENFGIDKPSKKIEYFNSFKNEVESGGKTINKTRKKLGSRKLGSRKLGSKKLGSKKLGPRTRKLGTKKL